MDWNWPQTLSEVLIWLEICGTCQRRDWWACSVIKWFQIVASHLTVAGGKNSKNDTVWWHYWELVFFYTLIISGWTPYYVHLCKSSITPDDMCPYCNTTRHKSLCLKVFFFCQRKLNLDLIPHMYTTPPLDTKWKKRYYREPYHAWWPPSTRILDRAECFNFD